MDSTAQKLAVVATVFDSDPRRAVLAARSNGFHGIEFDGVSPALDLTQLSQTGRREFRQILAASDLTLVALRVDVGGKGLTPQADIDRLLARLTQIMEAAKALVIPPLVCVEVGPLPEPAQAPKPKSNITPQLAGVLIIPEPQEKAPQHPSTPPPDPSLVSHIDGVLRELGSCADRIGVTLALRSDLASYAALDRAITAAACPWLGIDLDPVAVLRDIWSSDEIFSRFGPLIRHVRARDALVGADKRTKPERIGNGSTDWPRLLNNLDSTNYNGWITIDPLELPDRLAAAVAGADFLRNAS